MQEKVCLDMVEAVRFLFIDRFPRQFFQVVHQLVRRPTRGVTVAVGDRAHDPGVQPGGQVEIFIVMIVIPEPPALRAQRRTRLAGKRIATDLAQLLIELVIGLNKKAHLTVLRRFDDAFAQFGESLSLFLVGAFGRAFGHDAFQDPSRLKENEVIADVDRGNDDAFSWNELDQMFFRQTEQRLANGRSANADALYQGGFGKRTPGLQLQRYDQFFDRIVRFLRQRRIVFFPGRFTRSFHG